MSGVVRINVNGTRSPDFYLLGLTPAHETEILGIVSVDGVVSVRIVLSLFDFRSS